MSITDDARPESRSAPPVASGFEKSPPQDIAAEQSVLGGMLLSKDAIADVVEILKAHDFYRPVHATVFDTILDLYGRGEPADGVTVAAALSDSGDLQRIGGVPYLHTLIESVPTAANAAYYARIVAERAVLRRLVEAGTKIVQLGYGAAGTGGRDVDDIVDLAQQAVYDVTERRVSEDFSILADMLQPTLDEIEAVGATSGMMTGVPTGFSDLDRLLNGLHPGQLIIVAGRPGLGKALALDTPLATPQGWTTMGGVRVGDLLLGPDGRPTTVLATSAILLGRACYEVEFSDGSVIVADGDHQWSTYDRQARRSGGRAEIRTTEQIARTLRTGTADSRPNHAVGAAAPLRLPDRTLPVAPYALGAWLGAGEDATPHIPAADPEVVWHLEADGHRGATVVGPLRSLGVLGDKHIPIAYLRASERQRRALLAGLMDTAGTVTASGRCRHVSGSQRLAEGVRELVLSLGYPCGMTSQAVTFTTTDDIFQVERKAALHKERRRAVGSAAGTMRSIVDVRAVASVPVKCVSVDNADRLYLAGRTLISTHNSTASMDFARNAAIRSNCASAIFSLEMSKIEIVMRLLSAEARVPLHVLRSGQLSDDDWTKLARRMGEISEAPIFVDDTPSMSLMEIRAKARRLRQRHDLKLIVVDYLQLMTSPKRTESRQQEVADLSRGLKLLAKEVECPVIAVSQLNRGPEQRTDKRPQLSDLRESGCLTADTTLLRADTGAPVSFDELLRDGHQGVLVWSLDERRRMVPAPVTAVFASGTKEVFRLWLASGRAVKASGNHPFLTVGGWRPLDELTVGSGIAIPRRTPEPIGAGLDWSDQRLGLLAQLIGDGCAVRERSVHYTSQDEETSAFVERAAADEFGISPRRVVRESGHSVYLGAPQGRGNPLHDWFRELGIHNLHSDEKRVPRMVFAADNRQVAVFLRHLWVSDGNVTLPRGTTPATAYASSSRHLADDVMSLLSRFGIIARLKTVATAGRPVRYHVVIADGTSLQVFCREIGTRGDSAAQLLAAIEHSACGSAPCKTCAPGDGVMPNVPDPDASREAATDDVVWDTVVAVEPLGEMPVYDATVKGTHNFIADGIAAHNSIEQDADVVILLHRDDYYDKESPRAGEADFIVAKHRNGPTDTVTVAAQLHLSRFVDMAVI